MVRNFKLALVLSLMGVTWAQAEQAVTAPELTVDAKVALSSLLTLGDQHLSGLANSLHLLARTSEVQSAEWAKIEKPLALAAKANVEALNWFALRDGSYWSVQKGREAGNLKDRAYFPRLLRGDTVIGDLVVSKATGKSVAIVAVPVLRDGKVIGALGASVYLDQLSARLEKEMSLDRTMIFYSFSGTPIVGLDWDPAVIYADPMKLGREVSDAFKKMLKSDDGRVAYTFRGKKRTVIFRRSRVTGWWYAFGLIPEGRESPGSAAAGPSS
ncbi:MAG: cache domain-containing protein [Oligoflexia bacterium]|nr:cache domain-containing protein [Oligoflexia bacterium]